MYRTNQQRLAYLLECELEAVTEEASAEAEVEPEVELDASFSDFVAIGDADGEKAQAETEGHEDGGEVGEEEQGEVEAAVEEEQEQEEEEAAEEEEEAQRAYVGYNPDFPFATPPVAPSAEAPPEKPNAALIDLQYVSVAFDVCASHSRCRAYCSSGKPIMLVSAHIRARIVDFAAEVQLFHVRTSHLTWRILGTKDLASDGAPCSCIATPPPCRWRRSSPSRCPTSPLSLASSATSAIALSSPVRISILNCSFEVSCRVCR